MNIKCLEFYTANLQAQYNFYISELGFKLVEESNISFSFQAGYSLVIIHEELKLLLNPHHFAFALQNIEVEKAFHFLKDKVELIPNQRIGHFVVDFSAWEAQSLYFFDADRNIVEFILRNGDLQEEGLTFSADNIRSVCEVGLPVKNCIHMANTFKDKLGLKVYKGASDNFIPLGDDEGLLIIVEENVKKWFPVNKLAKAGKFELLVNTKEGTFKISCRKEDININ